MAADFAADFHLASPSLSADLDDFVASRLLLLLHLSPAASSLSKSVLLWAVVFSSCVFFVYISRNGWSVSVLETQRVFL